MYELIWLPPAFERMGDIVRALPHRKGEFAAALRWIHSELTTDPTSVGESREPPYRVYVVGQLAFRFRASPDEGKVYVVRVRLRRPR